MHSEADDGEQHRRAEQIGHGRAVSFDEGRFWRRRGGRGLLGHACVGHREDSVASLAR